jgi:hypothetical protein
VAFPLLVGAIPTKELNGAQELFFFLEYAQAMHIFELGKKEVCDYRMPFHGRVSVLSATTL